ncbi:MAG: hypothetical protein H8F28_27350 [Fibrella sp.]|nr:hypothetical protein [Armatimonadota bacterium]
MARHFYIRQTRQGEQEPVCTQCRSTNLKKNGHYGEKQRYFCRACHHHSYGLPPDRRPKCPFCKAIVYATLLADGRTQYRCSVCRRSFRSEYLIARREVSRVPLKHHFSFWLNRHARQRLVEYVQVARCTDAHAVRQIFRHVLTGKVFWTIKVGSRFHRLTRIERDPVAARMRFPNLSSESAQQKLKNSGGHYKRGFQPTVLGVQRITVMLDDAAKEGLVYAMRHLNVHHADAARWLLANAELPSN